ncbi:MAG: hypothetical protein HY721_09845, partial [Planctomycetes bacterium]|nr:hypothetical protein [Planctomycetota bacterium]
AAAAAARHGRKTRQRRTGRARVFQGSGEDVSIFEDERQRFSGILVFGGPRARLKPRSAPGSVFK